MRIQLPRLLIWQLYPRLGGFNPLTFTQNDVAVCDYFCQWAMGVVVGTLEYLDNITDPLPIFVSSFFGARRPTLTIRKLDFTGMNDTLGILS